MTVQDIMADIIEEMKTAKENNDDKKFRYFQHLYKLGFESFESFIDFLEENRENEYLNNLCSKYLEEKIDYKQLFEEDIRNKKINNIILSKTINYYISEYPELEENYIREKIREKVYEKNK
ncbi:MAG: hypothetical protein J1F35_03570 [Erysipelotrichales bacterium]|nr:hypothetical protein [Erysipelotrichales bacterium]